MPSIIVSGGFDDLRSPQVRFLQEAARGGDVRLLLWPDEMIEVRHGKPPKFPMAERLYFLESLRYVSRVTPAEGAFDPDTLPDGVRGDVWVSCSRAGNAKREEFCRREGMAYQVIPESALEGFPLENGGGIRPGTGRKKVIVTGCFDWLHTGHVRFFEEASERGDLYVVVGNDANLTHLKGPGHPLFPQEMRRYMAGAIRFVHQALVSTGMGWLDAEPEIALIKPDIYLVNEDGDKPEKREFCDTHGMEYVVLKRAPRQGLPRRQSTDLRGF